jgi:hypothetical protein
MPGIELSGYRVPSEVRLKPNGASTESANAIISASLIAEKVKNCLSLSLHLAGLSAGTQPAAKSIAAITSCRMRSNVRDQRRRAVGAPLAGENLWEPLAVPASGVTTSDDRCIA